VVLVVVLVVLVVVVLVVVDVVLDVGAVVVLVVEVVPLVRPVLADELLELRLRRRVLELLEGSRVGETELLVGAEELVEVTAGRPAELDSVSGVSGSCPVSEALDCRGLLPIVSPGSRLLVAASAGPPTKTAAAIPPITGRRRYSGRGARCRPM
jgi:hypothetical protein